MRWYNYDTDSVVPAAAPKNTPARIVLQKETPTDLEATGEGAKVESYKILRDGHLIIIRGNRVYNAQGQLMFKKK